MMFTETQIRVAAVTAHEMNRLYCRHLGDFSQPSWTDAENWRRDSVINGVQGVIAGNTPEQSHESWLAEKRATGWTYGETKDAEHKTHPCMVPYAELPPAQKYKDTIFVAVVRGMLGMT
jgi:hypothetical protein